MKLRYHNLYCRQRDTTISINGGEYEGYLKEDGSFVISSVPSGSYVVDIVNADYYYESVNKSRLYYLVSILTNLFQF